MTWAKKTEVGLHTGVWLLVTVSRTSYLVGGTESYQFHMRTHRTLRWTIVVDQLLLVWTMMVGMIWSTNLICKESAMSLTQHLQQELCWNIFKTWISSLMSNVLNRVKSRVPVMSRVPPIDILLNFINAVTQTLWHNLAAFFFFYC